MSRLFSTFFIVISILIFLSTIFIVGLKFTNRNTFTNNIDKSVEIYKDASGNPILAQGTCNKNDDCAPSGCGGEVCSDDPSLITTCVLNPDTPDRNVYTCGCISKKCVWYKQ